ncbi:iron ABC transporter permease [Verminephrobacter eiseniae]|nr:iron ABC transporter permease [Verminephrobacter eiseniae]MCW5304241.1 iron ABC transporter permease [Verminephrobacter eiseniae]MCW8181852.1 iron ABC transporter permease [Verminephrobacter eiseniae]MCW8191826.1 iron ABC transporter permease [Verminephrobacter eiseniae]
MQTNANPQTAAARPASGATPPPGATHQRALRCGAWLLLASALLALCGASVGSTGWDSLLHLGDDPVAWQILWSIRLPRTLGAWLAGALLGLAGAVAQGLFRNPLADPYLLGSASGAALGAAVALALLGVSPVAPQWLARIGITGMAFVGAAGAVLLTLLLARGVQHPLRLLLAGVIVGVVLGALRELLQLASPDILQAMQAFTLGSTAFVGAPACVLMALAWVSCAALAWMLARALDGLTLGEATAASLGLPLLPMRAGLVAALALATGTAVAQTGLIAFVGLAAPHLLRSIVRVTHARHILLSSLMGAVLLLAADILARWLLAPQELPVGVLTAALGGSYLLWLMHRRSTQGAGP